MQAGYWWESTTRKTLEKTLTDWELQQQQQQGGVRAGESGEGGAAAAARGPKGVPGGFGSVRELLDEVKSAVTKEATRKGVGAAPLLPTIAAAGVAGTAGLNLPGVPTSLAAAAIGNAAAGGGGGGNGDGGSGGGMGAVVQKGLGLLKVKGEVQASDKEQQVMLDRVGSPSVDTPMVGTTVPASITTAAAAVAAASAAAAAEKLAPLATSPAPVGGAAAVIAAASPFSSAAAQGTLNPGPVTGVTSSTSPCITTGVIQTPCQVQLANGKVTAYVASIQSALAAAPAVGVGVGAVPSAAATIAATAAAAATAALASGDTAAAGDALHSDAWPLMASVAVREGVQEGANNTVAVLGSNSSIDDKQHQEQPVQLTLSVEGGEEGKRAREDPKPAAAGGREMSEDMDVEGDEPGAAAAAAAGGMAKSSSGASAEVLKTLTAAATGKIAAPASATPFAAAGHLSVTSATGDKQVLAGKPQPGLQKDQSVHLIDVPLSNEGFLISPAVLAL
jgi:hypothetical protein